LSSEKRNSIGHGRSTIVSAFAPGRIELLGNHTDYNEGLVLAAAIDRGLTISGTARSERVIKFSSSLMGTVEADLSDLRPVTGATWVNYALGVVHELNRLGIPIAGFEAQIEGSLPPRVGLSSSAAFEVAVAKFLLKLHGRQLPPIEVAKLCQRAEHEFVGVRSGLLDQVVSIFGQANHLVYFDARTEEVRLISFSAEVAFVIAGSGRQRELAGGDYNTRREQTSAAAAALGVRALRDVSSATLNKRTDIDPLLKKRASHIVGENERVKRAIDFLERGDVRKFGQLLNESHESSRNNFENSTPELDLLVQLARALPGVLGARLTGAGFGGAIVALCRSDQAEAMTSELQKAFRERTGITSEMFVCQLGDGAR
jgi:galactokinase